MSLATLSVEETTKIPKAIMLTKSNSFKPQAHRIVKEKNNISIATSLLTKSEPNNSFLHPIHNSTTNNNIGSNSIANVNVNSINTSILRDEPILLPKISSHYDNPDALKKRLKELEKENFKLTHHVKQAEQSIKSYRGFLVNSNSNKTDTSVQTDISDVSNSYQNSLNSNRSGNCSNDHKRNSLNTSSNKSINSNNISNLNNDIDTNKNLSNTKTIEELTKKVEELTETNNNLIEKNNSLHTQNMELSNNLQGVSIQLQNTSNEKVTLTNTYTNKMNELELLISFNQKKFQLEKNCFMEKLISFYGIIKDIKKDYLCSTNSVQMLINEYKNEVSNECNNIISMIIQKYNQDVTNYKLMIETLSNEKDVLTMKQQQYDHCNVKVTKPSTNDIGSSPILSKKPSKSDLHTPKRSPKSSPKNDNSHSRFFKNNLDDIHSDITSSISKVHNTYNQKINAIVNNSQTVSSNSSHEFKICSVATPVKTTLEVSPTTSIRKAVKDDNNHLVTTLKISTTTVSNDTNSNDLLKQKDLEIVQLTSDLKLCRLQLDEVIVKFDIVNKELLNLEEVHAAEVKAAKHVAHVKDLVRVAKDREISIEKDRQAVEIKHLL